MSESRNPVDFPSGSDPQPGIAGIPPAAEPTPRPARRLVFLGAISEQAWAERLREVDWSPSPDEPLPPTASPFGDETPCDAPLAEGLLAEGRLLQPGDALVLARRRSPWDSRRPALRIIIGRHPDRADVLLHGAGLGMEHARIYLSVADETTNDLKAIRPQSVFHRGEVVGHEWRALRNGDRLELGPWRFRFEIDAALEPRGE